MVAAAAVPAAVAAVVVDDDEDATHGEVATRERAAEAVAEDGRVELAPALVAGPQHHLLQRAPRPLQRRRHPLRSRLGGDGLDEFVVPVIL